MESSYRSLHQEFELEGGRSPTGSSDSSTKFIDPEVVPLASRRRFNAAYKRRILELADRCQQPGDIGDLLRREGLYSSHLHTWRQQRVQSGLSDFSGKRGPKSNPNLPWQKKNSALQNQVDQLERKLQQAQVIIDIQKKLCALLELPTPEITENSK